MILRHLYLSDPTIKPVVWGHRLLMELCLHKKYSKSPRRPPFWHELKCRAEQLGRSWMNSRAVDNSWLYQNVSVFWDSVKQWKIGCITEVKEKDEFVVKYEENYTETLGPDSKFRFESMNPQQWWENVSIDVSWDGEYEWYEGK
eukprot:UN22917